MTPLPGAGLALGYTIFNADDAFLTREFLDLGCERQMLRALCELTEEDKLTPLSRSSPS